MTGARAADEAIADRAWSLVRRVHLGTRKPANWMQLVKFALVGGSGYVVNLVVFALLAEVAGLHHIPAAVGAFGPNDDWIEGVGHRPWKGHGRGHQLGQTAIRHNTAHIGEGVTIRGLAGFGLRV